MSVPHSYAKALYEAAKDASLTGAALDRLELDLGNFIFLMKSSPTLKTALLAPITNSKEKVALIGELAKKFEWSDLMSKFMALIARKDRFSFLEQIKEEFGSVRLFMEGGVSGRLVSAEPMSEADLSTLVKAFSQKLGKKVAFQVSTDPSLLAGMKVTVNGVTYDGSLRSQLQKLRDRFVAGLPGAHA